MSESVEIPRKALLRAVPAYEDARVGGESSTAAMRAALVAARPYLMPTREEILRAIGDTINRRIEFVESREDVERAYEEAVDAVMALLNGEIKKGEG